MRNRGFHGLCCLARSAAGVSKSAIRLSFVLGFLGMLPSAHADFLYAPIPSEPILSASLTANVGGLYANRFLFGVEENSAILLAQGFSPLDLSSGLFGTSSFPDPPLVGLSNDQTEIIGAAIPASFFPALRGGDIGYSFLFSDTGDGIFALDYIDLRIVTPSHTMDSLLGPATCFGMRSLPCPASTSGSIDVSQLPPNATGFDEPIANISLIAEPPPLTSGVPEPASAALLLIGAALVLALRKGRRMGLLGLIAAVLFQPPAQALTKEQALRALGDQVLKPSSSGAAIAVRMLPHPLFSGEVAPNTGGDPVIAVSQIGAGRPQWFAMVDLEPCAYFQHDVLYVFIDDSTGAVSVFPATDWPAINGTSLGQDPLPGDHPILIFPILPMPNSIQASSPGRGPAADYGDAPDGDPAYAQPDVPGRFPTRYTTTNSTFGPGAHALVTGLEMLGRTVSVEHDAQDPGDPDGLPNLADGDSDERMFIVWDPNTNPARANLLYDVTVASGAPDMDRYVNVLIDFDRNGAWGGSANGKEWAVMNQVVRVAPGTTATQVTPAFDWGGALRMPTQAWMRAALSRTPINPAPYGPAGWDGSGAFLFGEIEDSDIYLGFCSPDLTYAEALANPAYARFNPRPLPQNPDRLPLPAVDPPAPSLSTNSPVHFLSALAAAPVAPAPVNPPLAPGPKQGCNGTQIQYYALVVQGDDQAGDEKVKQAADTMQALLAAQGYQVTRLSPDAKGAAETTAANIATWAGDLAGKVVCQDKVLVYFIAHGANVANGQMYFKLRKKQGDKELLYKGAQLKEALDLLKSCPNGPCNRKGATGDLTVFIESCNSGNWVGILKGGGRRILTTSYQAELSQGGVTLRGPAGGEFSNKYDQAARNPNVNKKDPDPSAAGAKGNPAALGNPWAEPFEIYMLAQSDLRQQWVFDPKSNLWVPDKVQHPLMLDTTLRPGSGQCNDGLASKVTQLNALPLRKNYFFTSTVPVRPGFEQILIVQALSGKSINNILPLGPSTTQTGVPGVSIRFTRKAGELSFGSGTIAADGASATTCTNKNGFAAIAFTLDAAQDAVIEAEVPNGGPKAPPVAIKLDGQVTITAPKPLAKDLVAGRATFGPQSFDVTGTVVAVDTGMGFTLDACKELVNAKAIKGNIAFMVRGNCTYLIKIKNAQDAGAIGAILSDSVPDTFPPDMSGVDKDSTIAIPALSLRKIDGDPIRAALQKGTEVTARMGPVNK